MKFFRRISWKDARLGNAHSSLWFGIAWADVETKHYVLAPIPFNWIIGIGRRILIETFVFLSAGALRIDRHHASYWKGFDAGKKVGMEMAENCAQRISDKLLADAICFLHEKREEEKVVQ